MRPSGALGSLGPLVLLGLALLLGSPAPAASQDVRIELDPDRVELEVDATLTVRARALNRAGRAIPGARFRWFSMTPDVVSVAQNGTVTALAPGPGRIGIRAGGEVEFLEVIVPQLPASTIRIYAPVSELVVGTSAPVRVEGVTRLGNVIQDPPSEFESDDPSVATIDREGRIFAHAPGRTMIRVRAGVASAAIPIGVTVDPGYQYSLGIPPEGVRTGDVVRFRVDAHTPAGRAGPPLHPAWEVVGPSGQITAEGGDGVFVASKAGRYRVTARVGTGTGLHTEFQVSERNVASQFTLVGRGEATKHFSGDMWVFEGVDGRDYAYVGTFMHDWMKVFDVTDPAHPVLTDSLQLDARRINDVKIHPNGRVGVVTREQASNRRNGIVVLDLSDPAHPTVLSEFTATVTGGVHNTWIRGDEDLVYAIHNATSAMHIIDISDPTAPEQVGRWGLNKVGSTLHDVIVQEGYAYLSYWDDGLVMLDVGAGTHGGTPTQPVFVSQLSYPEGNTHTAWRDGRYLFVGDEIWPPGWNPTLGIDARGYIHVLDYIDPENPVEVARYEVPDAGAHNMWIEDGKMYVGYYQAGLRVVDITGELRGNLYDQGREIAVISTASENSMVPGWGMTWGAQLFKGNLFTSDINSGLWIAKLLDPAQVVF